jgi:hypothetical protein
MRCRHWPATPVRLHAQLICGYAADAYSSIPLEGPGACPIHRAARERLAPAALAKARNVDKLLSYISEHRATLFEWEASRQVARQHRRHGRR